MDAERKVIENIFPVTTTKAVYIDGTGKTLQEAIDNGEIGGGTTVTTASNFIVGAFLLVNDILFTKDPATQGITLKLNTKLTLNRIMVVCWSNGNASQISLPDGTVIPNDTGLYWDSKNGFTTVPFSSGIKASYEKVLVGLNFGGRITAGLLRPIWDKYNKYTAYALFEKERFIHMEEVGRLNSRTMHSMVCVGDELWTLECNNGVDFNGSCHVYSLPDLTYKSTFYQNIRPPKADGTVINLRLVCADYNATNNCLLLGSGTADGSDLNNMEAYIFYNADTLKNFTNSSNPITLDSAPNTILDFHTDGVFPDDSITAKLVWSELPDVVYLTHNNLTYCHKILLGVGTNQLEHGTYNYDASKRYNGTWKIIQTFIQTGPGNGNKDVQYYNGYLYYPVKYTSGGYRIYKTCLRHDGTMNTEMLIYDPVTSTGEHAIAGSPEGFIIYNGKMICSHATYGKFYIADADI